MSSSALAWTGAWHPFAEQFPMLSEDELRDLAESIKENGQLNPCIMNAFGLGLDGRNRVAACRIAGVEAVWVVSTGNPFGVIVAANVRHRHLSLGQRAAATAIELVECGKRQNGRFQRGSVPEAPDTSGSGSKQWAQRVAEAGLVLDWRPDLADEVLLGTLALDAAYQQAKQERDRRTAHDEKLRRLPADLAALVEAGVRDIDDALAEVADRATVERVDRIRDCDGAPPPSFSDRVVSKSITWREAATLAQQWQQERGESMDRDRKRIQAANSAWTIVRRIVEQPDHPYVTEILDGLGEADQEALRAIVTGLKGMQLR